MWTHICWLYKQRHRLTYFQGRKSAADIENGQADTRGDAEGVQPWHTHITRHAGSRWGAPVCYGELTLVLCDDPQGWDREGGLRKKGCVYVTADSHSRIEDTNTTTRTTGVQLKTKKKGGEYLLMKQRTENQHPKYTAELNIQKSNNWI